MLIICVKTETPVDPALVSSAKQKWNVKPSVVISSSSEVELQIIINYY